MRGWMVMAVALMSALTLAAACSSTADEVVDTSLAQRPLDSPATSSPLANLIGFSSDNEINRQQFVAIQERSDDLVAECMAAQDFRWLPNVPPPGSSLAAGDRASLAWAKAHGLGVTDQLAVLVGGSRADPNSEFLASLTEVERDRWMVALQGDTSVLVTTDEPVAFAPAGCLGSAFSTTRPWFELYRMFEQDLDTLAKRIDNDPRVVEHRSIWATCMNDNGYAYVDEQAMSQDFLRRLLAIPGVSDLMVSSDATSASATNLDAILASPEFGDLVVAEREAAVANVGCAAQFSVEAAEVRDSYEQRFIIDHQTRLDAALSDNPIPLGVAAD